MKKPLRVLFVCYGNICRSPMAAGIAARLHGDLLAAESAGIGAVSGARPTPEAVLAVRSLFRADIVNHAARSLDAVDLPSFDAVVAMDFIVYQRLKARPDVREDKLLGWDIEDPLGLGYETYRETAKKIKQRLDQFLIGRGCAV